MKIEILAPLRDYENINDMSIVAKIVCGDTSFLFTGDIEWDAEHDLTDAGVDLSADVLKVPHHGSDTNSSYVFLRAVTPACAVISVGQGNAYGHPVEDTLNRLKDVGTEVIRTDEMGTVIRDSDDCSITFIRKQQRACILIHLGSRLCVLCVWLILIFIIFRCTTLIQR